MCIFKGVGKEILGLIEELESILSGVDNEIITERRNKQNRNIKQIVGHLIDSSSNNTHRVIHLQYQKSPIDYPDYANLGVNDKWIAIQNYNDENWFELVQLLKYSNTHFAHVIKKVNEECLDNEWISALNTRITLKDMIEDYPRHIELHIKEIKELINSSDTETM